MPRIPAIQDYRNRANVGSGPQLDDVRAGLPDQAMIDVPSMSMPDDQPIDVDLGLDAGPSLPDTFEMGADGNVVPFTGSGGMMPLSDDEMFDDGFDENLAEQMGEAELDELGRELAELVEQDLQDRKPHEERFQRGMEMMGLTSTDIDDGPFPGASNAVHPLLAEAITQFWARSMGELLPPDGPVKAKAIGKQTEETNRAAERVQEYENWTIMHEDEGYLVEKSRLFWQLPVHGSGFSKTSRDPISDKNCTIYVSAEDLIAPSEATDLATAPRFTHRMRKFRGEIARLQRVGYYRDVDLGDPDQSEDEHDSISTTKLEIQDIAENDDAGDDPQTDRYDIYEISVFREIDSDERAEPGIEMPYVITIDRGSERVLAIRRNWMPEDPTFGRELQFEKYDYIGGIGFYGMGLLHLIGGLQVAATGAMRVLLDGAATASMNGGFIAQHANLKGQEFIMEPGKWKPVPATFDDLRKAFFPIPVKDPSPALFQLLGMLVDAGKSFAASTEIMTGETDPKNAPVGSTLAMIEQGGKVMSTIHRMLHASLGRELRMRKRLSERYAPEDGYPYEVAGEERSVYFEDFAKTHIIPVSDPNIFSIQQRMAINAELYRIASETGVIPMDKVVRRILLDMRVADPDDLLPPEEEAVPYDAAGEIQAIILGKPVKVVPDQPHVAHLAALSAWAQNPQQGGNPIVAAQAMPRLMTVAAQHLAYAFSQQARAAGVPTSFMDPETGKMIPPDQQAASIPPEQISQMLAQLAPQLAQMAGIPAPPEEQQGQDPAAEAKMMEIQAKTEAIKLKSQADQQKVQTDAAAANQKLQQEQQKHQFEMARDAQKLEHERAMAQLKADIEIQKNEMKMMVESMKAQMQEQQAMMQQQAEAARVDQEMRLQEQQAAQQASQMERQGQIDEVKAAQEMERGARDSEIQEAQAEQQYRHAEDQNQRQSQLDRLRGPEGEQ